MNENGKVGTSLFLRAALCVLRVCTERRQRELMEADTEQVRIYSSIKSKVRSLLLLLISAVLRTGVTASISKTESYCRNTVVREQWGKRVKLHAEGSALGLRGWRIS